MMPLIGFLDDLGELKAWFELRAALFHISPDLLNGDLRSDLVGRNNFSG